MSEMVERIARSLCIADGKNPDAQQSYPVRVYTTGRRTDTGHDTRVSHMEDVMAAPQWQDYCVKARDAIAAMREPTEAMMAAVDCGGEKKEWLSGKAWRAGYQAMIDEALK